jgi:hypothetical protein
MDFFIEIIFGRIIVRFFGLYSRFLFFKIIGKNKSLKYLSGEASKKEQDGLSQDFFNALVGVFVFSVLAVGIVKFIDRFFY